MVTAKSHRSPAGMVKGSPLGRSTPWSVAVRSGRCPAPSDVCAQNHLALISTEWVEQAYTGSGQLLDVPGHQDPVPPAGGGGHQAIHDRQGIGGVEPAPLLAHVGGDRDQPVGEAPTQGRQPYLV